MKEEGRILSIESMGLTDGPGIRFVVFFSGCALRCLFCHNPDAWAKEGIPITSGDLVSRALRFRPYFERSGGGVTFSGGEPLLQGEFLLDCLSRLKAQGIHTCIDTAGVGNGDEDLYRKILEKTDLVLYDVKETTNERYLSLCGQSIDASHVFERCLLASNVPFIVRHVVVPNRNDGKDAMHALATYIKERLPSARDVELLPYHRMGAHKYADLGMKEPLGDTPEMSDACLEQLKRLLDQEMKESET